MIVIHKFAIEDVLIKLANMTHPVVAITTDVVVVLNVVAVLEEEFNFVWELVVCVGVEEGLVHAPEFNIYPELHTSHSILLVLIHFCQFRGTQFKIVNLTSLWNIGEPLLVIKSI